MLDIFASLGVNAFDVTETGIAGHKHGFRAYQRVEQLRRWMPYLIQSAVERQHNLIVRPKSATAQLVQLDDISRAGLEGLRTTAFLILMTSPETIRSWLQCKNAMRTWPGVRAGAASIQAIPESPAWPAA